MKVCNNCGTENSNNAVICENCGGHEFKHKCNNCGTIYAEGKYCPTCGYVKGSNKTTAVKAAQSTTKIVGQPSNSVKKRKTWLWVLGWIFILPLPLTILLMRNQKMNKVVKIAIIVVVWLFYLLIVFAGRSGSSPASGSGTDASDTRATVSENIKSLKFLSNENVTVKVGETKSVGGYLKVKAKRSNDLLPEDVILVSEDPKVAIISLNNVALKDCFYCDVTGVGAGETRVYATSKDGSIVSDYINVSVPQPILIETIEIQNVKTELVIGEKTAPSVTISPRNAEDKSISWTSSDESVATVDTKGAVTAVGGGSAIITATSRNGVAAFYTVNVDGSKHLMNLRVTHPRQDDVNIGSEWSYTNEINGERVYSTIGLALGETLTIHTKITESDNNPDVGENTMRYTVTEDDLMNGFTVTMDVYVTENGGKNSGQSAHFVVTYTFTPAN